MGEERQVGDHKYFCQPQLSKRKVVKKKVARKTRNLCGTYDNGRGDNYS